MNKKARDTILGGIGDSRLRQVAEEHRECLHLCVWLVKDEKGPLQAGGNPQLPMGRDWPRIEGMPLVYLLSINASLLPDWSPLPRDCGDLLVFVGFNTCEIVMAARGDPTQEVEPPLEEYLGRDPIAGDALEIMQFRLEEGLHAGVPESWLPMGDGVRARRAKGGPVDSLIDLNRALQPEESIGRLFGHHEWWAGVNAAVITKYSYLEANGYRYAWYEDLDGPVDKLQQQLEKAKSQTPLADERVPKMADVVVQTCEERVAETEQKIAERQGVTDANARAKIEHARETLTRRWKRWHKAKGDDPESRTRRWRN